MQLSDRSNAYAEHAPSDWQILVRALAFRGACGGAAILVVYLGSLGLQVSHPAWIAASLGLPLAAAVAFTLGQPPPGFLSLSRRPRATARVSSAMLLAAAAILFPMVLLPILTTKLAPFNDYANHLARTYVIAFGGGDALLSRFYAIKWQFIPNLAMDIIVPPIAKLTGIFLAGKLFLLACMLLLLTGPHAIYVALHRSLSLGPLVAALFLYNGITKFGLVNYEFGVGLALWSIAAWIALREAAPIRRAVVSALWVVALFFSHMSALFVYGVAIASFEAWLEWSGQIPRHRRLADLAVLVVPFALVVPLMLLGPAGSAPPMAMHWGGLFARREGIRFIIQAYAWPYDLAAGVVMAAAAIWALSRRILHVHPWTWMFLALAAIAYLVVPNEAMGSWGAAERLPIAFLFVLLGMLEWDLTTAWRQRVFLAGLAALALLRTATVETVWLRFDRMRADFETSLALIAPGSRVLVARDWTRAVDSLSAIAKLPCLAVIERSSLVALEYSHPLQQILVVKPPYRAIAGGYDDDPIPLPLLLSPPPQQQPAQPLFFAPSGRIYWSDWTRSYDYVYLLDRLDVTNPAPDHLDLLRNGDRYQLFRVRHP